MTPGHSLGVVVWAIVWAIVGCVALPGQRQTSGGALIAEQACFDVQHYDLRLTVDPDRRRIDGTLAMTARMVTAADRVALDLDADLEVTEVTVRGRAARFRHEDLRVWIDVDEPFAEGDELHVTVAYGGEPREAPMPPWRGGFTWAKTGDGRPWIATSCQGEGADLWWPCKDHPSDEPAGMDLRITVPEGLVCAANGVLQGEPASAAGRTEFHWRVLNPISNYTVALNIAPYVVLEETYQCVDGTDLPVRFWALPEHEAEARAFLPEVLDHLRHFEEVCGPYPFRNEKYGVAETPHLGMEHQTIIAYGNGYQGRASGRQYDWLHHHEAAHEWWANLVTCRDWKDMWIHEGIGTYMQALYLESRFGAEAYRAEMADKRRGFLNRAPLAPRASHDTQAIYFGASGSDIYNKGSWVCHTLRWLLGDEAFFTVLRRWAYPDPELEQVLDGSQTRFTDTDELLAIAEQHSGRELGWFFEVYLRRRGLPQLGIEHDGEVLTLRWRTRDNLPFPMPVPVRVGDEILRVEVGAEGARVATGGAAWHVDPDDRLLMRSRGPRQG